jgi:hypothetical protein
LSLSSYCLIFPVAIAMTSRRDDFELEKTSGVSVRGIKNLAFINIFGKFFDNYVFGFVVNMDVCQSEDVIQGSALLHMSTCRYI